MKKKLTVVLLLLLSSLTTLYAQIQIIDKKSKEPIVNVFYTLGKSSGYSNIKGEIILQNIENQILRISHLSYGVHSYSGKQLEQIQKDGLIELDSESLTTLSSISVYALKERNPKDAIRLQTADWVHHDAGAVLKQINGFDAIKKSGNFGYDPTFRGFKLDQLNIVNDGCMSATAACPNRMDPPTSQIPINLVQDIEVIKGPHSFRYGPSMGAVINFRMLDPVFSESTKAFGRITAGYESNGNVKRTEGQLGFRNSRVQVSGNGSYSKGEDFKAGNKTEIPGNFERGTVGLMADIKTAENQILTWSVNRNFARNTDFPVLMMDLLTDDTWMTQAKYKVVKENAWYSEWTTQASAGIVKHLMGNILRNPTNMIAQTDAFTKTWNARTEFLIEKNKAKIYTGADTKTEFISGDRTREMLMGPSKGKVLTDFIWQDSQILRFGVFADVYFQLDKNTLSLAARVDDVKADAQKPAESFLKNYSDLKQTDMNTSVSLGMSSRWTDELSTGIWFGRGVRSANISERYINYLAIGKDPYEMLGNPDLKPEKNNQLDVNVTYKKRGNTVQLSGYYSQVNDYISSVIDPTLKPLLAAPGVRRYLNIEKAKLYGLELGWNHHWAKIISQTAAFSYNYGQNLSEDIPLPEISPMNLRYQIEAQLLKKYIMPFGAFRYSFKQDRVASNYGEVTTAAYKVFDFGLKSQILQNLQASLMLTNAFNENYREHLSRFISANNPLFSQGRSWVASLSYRF